MKLFKTIITVIVFCILTAFNGAYDFTVTALNGNDQSLSIYSGKRMMIVVLPVTQTASDSAFLINLDTLSRKYEDSIMMVGVPSYEDGYHPDSLPALTNWYDSMLGSQFLVTRGMYTRKNSAGQSDLFAWLTHDEQNGHFDYDITGPGQKYFISADGNLYALLVPEAELTEQILKQILRQQQE